MGAGFSSPLVDSNLVFPAPPSSYAANTDNLLWLHSTVVAEECAVPGFLITPKESGAIARPAARPGRQEIQQQQQTQQQRRQHHEQRCAPQQEQQRGQHYGVPQSQQLRETRVREEPLFWEVEWRKLQRPEMKQEKQQQQQQSRAATPHQHPSSNQQCRSVRRQPHLEQHMSGGHLSDSQEHLLQSRRQGSIPGLQRASLCQQEVRRALTCTSAPSQDGPASASAVNSKATHPSKSLPTSDAFVGKGAPNCCAGDPNVTSKDTTAKESNRIQEHATTATGKGAVEDAALDSAHTASTPGIMEEVLLKDDVCGRYHRRVSDAQKLEHLHEQPSRRRQQQDKQFNLRPRVLTLRRSLSCSCFPGRNHKYGQGFCMLYFHGNACDANMMRGWLQAVADEVGLTILIFEYPGYGLLEQQDKSCRGVDLCARIAFEYIVQRLHYPVEKIILCGRSIGTGAAAWLARELGDSGLHVGGLVLIAPFVSLAKVAADWMEAPVTLMQVLVHNHWNTEDALRCIPNVPLCIIHGKMDDVIPVAQSKRLTDAAPRPPWLRVIHFPETAGHDVGLSPSSLLLDVVAPLQLFLSKVARAGLDRKFDAKQVNQSFFQEMSSIRRCRTPARVHYAYYFENKEQHHQRRKPQQRRQQRTQTQRLQLHLHEQEVVHSRVKRMHHSLPVHAKDGWLRCGRAPDFSAFLDTSGDSRRTSRPLRRIAQKHLQHLLRHRRHRRHAPSSREHNESSQNGSAPQRSPLDFWIWSSAQERSACSCLLPCCSAQQPQQVGQLQHGQKQRQYQQRPQRHASMETTERSRAVHTENHTHGVDRREQSRAFEPVKHCSRQAHDVPVGRVRFPAIRRPSTTDPRRSSGALRSRVITALFQSLASPSEQVRISSEASAGLRITDAAEAKRQQQVPQQHVAQPIEPETFEGGKPGETQKFIEQPRKTGLRIETERTVHPPRIRDRFLPSRSFWDDTATRKPRRSHLWRSTSATPSENENSKLLNLRSRVCGESQLTPAQPVIVHSLRSASSVRCTEDITSAGRLSAAPSPFFS